MGIEKTGFGKFLSHIYEHYLPYWNGLNTVIFAFVGILFSLNKEIFWNKIHSNTLGWILFGVAFFLSIWHIFKQVKNSKTIEKNRK